MFTSTFSLWFELLRYRKGPGKCPDLNVRSSKWKGDQVEERGW